MSEFFHAQVCLSEAHYALNCDAYAPEYKIKRIKQERADYIEAYFNSDDADADVQSVSRRRGRLHRARRFRMGF